MMLVDMQVAFGDDLQVDAAVSCDLIEHVIKKMQTGRYFGIARTVEVYFYIDICLFSSSPMLDHAFAQLQKLIYFLPVSCLQHRGVFDVLFFFGVFELG